MITVERLGLKVKMSESAFEAYKSKSEEEKDNYYRDIIKYMKAPSNIPIYKVNRSGKIERN